MPQFTGPLAHHIHSTTTVSYSKAQKWIDAYVVRSETYPHMHPDAQLGRKPGFGTNGSQGGVTMAQLRKVSRGIGGEWVEPEAEEQGADGEMLVELPEGDDDVFERKGKKTMFTDEAEGAGFSAKSKADNGEELMDLDEWQEQRDGNELGEIGERSNYVGQVDHVPDVVAPGEEKKRKTDKEARKKAKKARRDVEKKETAAKKRKTAED